MALDLLFDLDGTLTDAAPGIVACIQHALFALDRPVPPAEDLRWCLGPPLQQSFPVLLGTDDVTLVTRAVALYRERYIPVGLFENAVYPGVAEGLHVLQERGHRLFVATSKPHAYARRIVEHFQLAPFFEVVHGSELSGERVDKADLIRHVVATEGLTRPWMIGDRRHDVEGARANGIPAVGVLWGYGSEEELRLAGATRLVSSMPELCAVVEEA